MNKRVIKKIFLVIMCFVLIFVPHISYSKDNEDWNENYDKFLRSLNVSDYIEGSAYYSVKGRKNLIIGCSPVVFCGMSCGEEILDEYNFDIVGFGGTRDAELVEWLRKLSYEIEYDKIVIWGNVNDLMCGIFNNSCEFSDEYKNVLNAMIGEARIHLKNPITNNIYVIKPRYMVEGLDTYIPQLSGWNDTEYSGSSYYYNILVNKVANYISALDVNLIDINGNEFSTSKENSEWYLHYTNKDVFIALFNKIV